MWVAAFNIIQILQTFVNTVARIEKWKTREKCGYPSHFFVQDYFTEQQNTYKSPTGQHHSNNINKSITIIILLIHIL